MILNVLPLHQPHTLAKSLAYLSIASIVLQPRKITKTRERIHGDCVEMLAPGTVT